MWNRLLACGLVLASLGADEPPARQGQNLPPNRVEFTVNDGVRTIRSNGIPDHEPGVFPRRGNPNTIREQRYEFRMPAEPKPAEKVTTLELGPFGVAVNGVLFDPGAAEWWRRNPDSGWRYEALSGAIDLGLDRNNAHVQPNGAYHYHGLPTGLIEKLTKGEKPNRMLLIGCAADGFPIYARDGLADPKDPASGLKPMRPSYKLKEGERPSGAAGPGGPYDGSFVQDYEYVAGSGDLDECNGRVGVTPEYPDGIYHYYVTDAYPFIPRAFRGNPDPSFRRGPPGGRPPFGPPRGRRPGGPPGPPPGPPPGR
jgi:hypothetical protein